MLHRHLLASLLALLGWTGIAHAQAALGTPISPENRPEAAVAPPASPAPVTEYRLRRPILGRLARTLTAPIRALMPPTDHEELPPTREAIARMTTDGDHSPAEITAAKVKLDESQARARRAAVKYLATVDCNYYPEAEASLIAALRADRSESVRYEAALALGTSRGLTMKIVEALHLTVLGFDIDGNPPETSERVKQAAQASLNRNLTQGMSGLSTPEPPMYQEVTYWAPADPFGYPPVIYVPTYAPLAPTATPQERDLAQRVGISAAPAPAPVPAPTVAAPSPRPRQQFFSSGGSWRESIPFLRAPSAPRNPIDPRLQGLTPIGSDAALAIPSVQPPSSYNQP